MPSVPVSEDGVRQLFYDHTFLDELVKLCPIEDEEWYDAVDRSDMWWWLCFSWEKMKRRKDLKRTARNWVQNIRVSEFWAARQLAEDGKFDHLLPPEVRACVGE